MRHPQYTLTRHDVHHLARHRLLSHLRLPDHSRRCPATVLVSVVLAAAARLSSLFATAGRLLGVPSAETIRQALLGTLPDQRDLERRLNRALAADLPRCLTRRPQPLACDLTLRPYHGRPLHDPAEVYRSKARSGTSHFHAYATAYVVRHGRRFTLALTAVRRGEPLDDVLWRLLRQVRRAGVTPQYLLLDRGFCTVAVIRYLQAARRPFLMPLPLRGKPAGAPGGPSGSRVFQYARRSGWASYTLRSAGRTATVRVAVQCRNFAGQWGRSGRQRLVYAFWGLEPRSVAWLRQAYRRRFAVETSYRQMNQARISTTTRSPAVRLFYVGVALLLRNVWVWLHYLVLATPRRGGRAVNLHRLRFQTLLLWLAGVIEEQFGVSEEVHTERPTSQRVGSRPNSGDSGND